MYKNNKISILKYYMYTFFVQMRLTRIVNILYLIQVVGISLVQFTLLQSIFSISQFLMEIPSGVLGDHFKKKTITTTGLLLLITSQIVICSNLFINSDVGFYILAIAFILEGMGRAFISGADDALFFEKIRDDGYANDYDKIRGKCQLISSISLGIATLFGTYLYSFNARLPYIGQSLAVLCTIPIILSVSENKVINLHTSKEENKNSLKNMIFSISIIKYSHQIMFMAFFVIVIFAVINTVFGIIPNYMSEIGFTSVENGTVFMILSFIGGLVATQSYRFSKWSQGKLILLTSSMMASSLLFISFHNKILTFIGLVLLYIIIDVLDPIAMKAFHIWVEDNVRATFISLISFAISAMTMILYPITGVIVQTYGMFVLLSIVAFGTIIMLVISYFLFAFYGQNRGGKKI